MNEDGGSWVLDFDTGNLLGHLGSAYIGTSLAYVILAKQIFQDIRERLGNRRVTLMTRDGYLA